jgi:hypothetical protein
MQRARTAHISGSARASREKKAREIVMCRLRDDKVFVYFTRLKMSVRECVIFFRTRRQKT